MLSFEKFSEFCVNATKFISCRTLTSNKELSIHYKEDGTEVTSIDLFIEDKLRNIIANEFPENGIIGEEKETINESANYKWIIDPIDGTYGFVKGVPLFGTLIGFIEQNEPKYGFARMPEIGNSWISGDGEKALLNGKPLSTPAHQGWQNSLILTTDQQTIETSPLSKYWKSALKYGATARTWGDCFGYYMVCSGNAEFMADTCLKPYDIMPLIPILRGSGLEVHQVDCSDWSNVIACKKGVFEQLK